LAGLQSIDGSVYEAARIDGATFWQTTMRITIPLLKPIFFYCFLMATISSFKTFAEPYALTGGGPGEATRTLSLYMYQNGFEFLKLGYASAISYVLIAIIMVVSVVQMVFFRSEVE
jgi:ABC-type sugar transport system permease subunit